MQETLITSQPCVPYTTHWHIYNEGEFYRTYRWHGDGVTFFTQNPAYSTGRPRDPDGMRGHAWGPERDDLDTQTCTAPLAHPVAWWWRRRWACALNAYGKRCDLRAPMFWLDRHKWREAHCSGRQCIVETCRPGMRETSLDSASCSR